MPAICVHFFALALTLELTLQRFNYALWLITERYGLGMEGHWQLLKPTGRLPVVCQATTSLVVRLVASLFGDWHAR